MRRDFFRTLVRRFGWTSSVAAALCLAGLTSSPARAQTAPPKTETPTDANEATPDRTETVREQTGKIQRRGEAEGARGFSTDESGSTHRSTGAPSGSAHQDIVSHGSRMRPTSRVGVENLDNTTPTTHVGDDREPSPLVPAPDTPTANSTVVAPAATAVPAGAATAARVGTTASGAVAPSATAPRATGAAALRARVAQAPGAPTTPAAPATPATPGAAPVAPSAAATETEAKTEDKSADPAKPEAADATTDAAKPDAASTDATKPDATKPDGSKPDATKPDAASDPFAPAASKTDSSKSDTSTDATKPDAPSPDAPSPDASKDAATTTDNDAVSPTTSKSGTPGSQPATSGASKSGAATKTGPSSVGTATSRDPATREPENAAGSRRTSTDADRSTDNEGARSRRSTNLHVDRDAEMDRSNGTSRRSADIDRDSDREGVRGSRSSSLDVERNVERGPSGRSTTTRFDRDVDRNRSGGDRSVERSRSRDAEFNRESHRSNSFEADHNNRREARSDRHDVHGSASFRQFSRAGLFFDTGRSGALVVDRIAPRSVVARWGLRPHDEIVAVNGRAIYGPDDFVTWVESNPRTPATLIVVRDGAEQSLRIDPQPFVASYSQVDSSPQADRYVDRADRSSARASLGVVLDRRYTRGAMVQRVREGSPAEQAGLRAGDYIIAIDGQPVNSPERLVELVSTLEPGADVDIEFSRREMQGSRVTLGESPEVTVSSYSEEMDEQPVQGTIESRNYRGSSDLVPVTNPDDVRPGVRTRGVLRPRR